MRLAPLAGLVAVLLAAPGRAAEAGPALGLRLGWAFPLGDASAGEPLSATFAGAVPVGLEAHWRLGDRFSAGIHLEYGFGLLAARFADAFSSARGGDLRAGAAARFRFPTGWPLEPWVGAGAGWEWARFWLRGAAPGRLGLSGPELQLEAGADHRLAGRRLAVGPFLSARLGRYDTVSESGPAGGSSRAIRRTAIHSWLQLGIRGGFDW